MIMIATTIMPMSIRFSGVLVEVLGEVLGIVNVWVGLQSLDSTKAV